MFVWLCWDYESNNRSTYQSNIIQGEVVYYYCFIYLNNNGNIQDDYVTIYGIIVEFVLISY